MTTPLQRVRQLLRRTPAGTGDLSVTDQIIVGFRYWTATIRAYYHRT